MGEMLSGARVVAVDFPPQSMELIEVGHPAAVVGSALLRAGPSTAHVDGVDVMR